MALFAFLAVRKHHCEYLIRASIIIVKEHLCALALVTNGAQGAMPIT
jgi:hypothetical protein